MEKMEKIEKIAKKITLIEKYVMDGNYKQALAEMYGWDLIIYGAIDRKILRLMNERTDGDFLMACGIFEDAAELEMNRIKKASKSKTVKNFIEEYRNWSSGYSMGETVQVVYKTTMLGYTTQDVTDNRRKYKGIARKYNNRIAYGAAELIVDLTGPKMKTKLSVVEKNRKH